MFSIQGFLTCQSKLPMNYKHLSQVERYQIYALMKAGHDQTQIAKLLDRHKSTTSREISRTCGLKGYRAKQACELTANRSEQSRNAACAPAWVCEQAAGIDHTRTKTKSPQTNGICDAVSSNHPERVLRKRLQAQVVRLTGVIKDRCR